MYVVLYNKDDLILRITYIQTYRQTDLETDRHTMYIALYNKDDVILRLTYRQALMTE